MHAEKAGVEAETRHKGQPRKSTDDTRICKFQELEGKFKVLREIGRGSYGVVFKGIHRSDFDEAKGLEFYDSDDWEDESKAPPRYAIKRIFPTINAPFILIEMLILKLVKGHPNITDLVAAYRKDSQVSLIFKYQRSTPFLVFVETISPTDVKHYLYQILLAINHLSKFGVVHRDIKPSNILWDPRSKKGILIDFGLSEIETDEANQPKKMGDNETVGKICDLQKKMAIKNRTGTKGYMPPETIFNAPEQGSAVDIWAVGVIMLSFLMKRHPIISLNNTSKVKNFTIANLIPLALIFGAKEIKAIAHENGYGLLMPEEVPQERLGWRTLITDESVPDCAIELLDRMLTLDPKERITPEEAIAHPFFEEVRGEPMDQS